MSKNPKQYWKVVTHEQENTAEVFLYGYIGQRDYYGENKDKDLTDLAVVQELRKLEEKYSTIKLRINSPGGSVFHGDPIINAIRNSKAEIHTYADGVVASMAADIWIAGHVRHMSLNSKLMIHSISTGAYGNAKQLMTAVELVMKMDDVAILAMAADTGMSEDDVRANFYDYEDHWFTPAEVLKMGLITEIEDYQVEPIAEEPEKLAYGELVKLYEPNTNLPTPSIGDHLRMLSDKIFKRTTDKPSAPPNPSKTSLQMNIEEFQKALTDGELTPDAVADALKSLGYSVEKAEPAPPADPQAEMQKLITTAVDAAMKDRDAQIVKLQAEVKALGDAPGDNPTGTPGGSDPGSGVDTGATDEIDYIKLTAEAAGRGDRIAKF
jgi:ATP-dependent protease ClpP protease subunit